MWRLKKQTDWSIDIFSIIKMVIMLTITTIYQVIIEKLVSSIALYPKMRIKEDSSDKREIDKIVA